VISISSPEATASKTALKLRATSVAVMVFFMEIRLSDALLSINGMPVTITHQQRVFL
jgi:hypothetical protein